MKVSCTSVSFFKQASVWLVQRHTGRGSQSFDARRPDAQTTAVPATPSACMCVQSCLTVCDPMDRSPPGSSIHGVFQAGILEWVLLQGIFPTQGSNRCLLSLLHWQADSLLLGPRGKPSTQHRECLLQPHLGVLQVSSPRIVHTLLHSFSRCLKLNIPSISLCFVLFCLFLTVTLTAKDYCIM